MSVGPFLSHDTGFASLLGPDNWISDDYYAVLATDTEVPDRASQVDYEDILAECADGDYSPVALASKTCAVNGTDVRFDCAKINFGSAVSISGRYLYILKGTAATPNNADEIVGHIDLDGSGNISSVGAEFSFDPHANGLFYVPRTVAA